MKTFENITLVGTSHIAKQSIDEVKKTIESIKPSVVALELDKNRLYSLLNRDKEPKRIFFSQIKSVGLTGFLFSLMASYAEKKLGVQTGNFPGAEMLAGFFEAKNQNSKIALIDQDISKTLGDFSKRITWKEKFRFLADIFKSIFNPKGQLKKMGIKKIDLNKVPSNEVIEQMIKSLRERYPNVYYVLIEKRNRILAKNLLKLKEHHPEESIVCVLGAGHVEDVINILKSN